MRALKSVYSAQVPSKANLTLAVTGKRGGLHTLQMTVCPYPDFSDRVEFFPVTDCADIEVEGVSAQFKDFDKDRFLDFYIPKARAAAERFGVGGRLRIYKGVPLGAGLGGSSASVAATVSAMSACACDLGESARLDDVFLLSMGSDVPCMTAGGACVVEGVGEIVKPFSGTVPEFDVYIAEGGSDTAACYALYDRMKEEDPSCDTSLCSFENKSGAKKYFNDLTAPAVALNPNIGELIRRLQRSYEHVVMSGSGSAVLGINRIR